MKIKNKIMNLEEVNKIFECEKYDGVLTPQYCRYLSAGSNRYKNELNHVKGKVIVSVDLDAKNWHTFQDGTKIRRERQYNELNRRITEPVNAIVISGDTLPNGSEILCHPNEFHISNQIFDYTPLSGDEVASTIKYFSINEKQCFVYRETINHEWKGCKGFDTALRVFKPYTGTLVGIDPTLLKNVLYCTSGEYKGMVVHTVKAADYEIIYQEKDGKEGRIIRFRPNGIGDREPEAIAISHELTEKINKGELLVGLEISDAKKINV
jgi:hypothetical protein